MAHSMQLNTATGMIKLQVPPRKLGAVLSAIGAALDGHPWTPYTPSKGAGRGCRGGKGKRERISVGVPNKNIVNPATKLAAAAEGSGVPQLPLPNNTTLRKTNQSSGSTAEPTLVTPEPRPDVPAPIVAATSSNARKRNKQKAVAKLDAGPSPSKGPEIPAGGTQITPGTVLQTDDESVRAAEVQKLRRMVSELNTQSKLTKTVSVNTEEIIKRNGRPCRGMEFECYVDCIRHKCDANCGMFCIQEKSFLHKHSTQVVKDENLDVTVPGHNEPAHLATCGPACSCPASSNAEYLELLGKHRRVFVASASGRQLGNRPSDRR